MLVCCELVFRSILQYFGSFFFFGVGGGSYEGVFWGIFSVLQVIFLGYFWYFMMLRYFFGGGSIFSILYYESVFHRFLGDWKLFF